VTRCVAVDWSGRQTGEGEFIWIAEAHDGRLVFLENGFTRAQAVQWLIDVDGDVVAGLDFSFALPGWYSEHRGWRRATEVWQAMRDDGERILSDEIAPFWRRGRPDALASPQRALRRTEREDVAGAKSTFQIGGAGSVGTGSLRGMALLPALSLAGYAIWPFDPARRRTLLEIYPAAMYPPTTTGRVIKRRWQRRHALLAEWFPGHPAPLLERAAGSEDAFDAAVSALVMDRHATALSALPDLSHDPGYALEGRAWTPATAS
jgi:hypothetical protein